MTERRVLFVSNGFAEDMIGARIIAALDPDVRTVAAYPLVGTGAYPQAIPLLEPRRELPSSGFSLRAGLRGLRADVQAGLAALWLDQRRTLLEQRGRYHLAVAVGDAYCLWMAHLAFARPAFVATADSVRTGGFGRRSLWVLRRYARRIYARDAETATALSRRRLPVVALGNVMMDLIDQRGETFGFPPDAPVVTLLPGSRRDAAVNSALLAETAAIIAGSVPDVRFLLAVAPTVSERGLREHLGAVPGVTVVPGDTAAAPGTRVHLTQAFGDAIRRAWIVVGMAGTAHEQAAGLGRPIVAFPGPGAQFGPAFLKTQHQLLGDAVVPGRDSSHAAAAAIRLLTDPVERERRGAVGRERMGPPGAARRIALELSAMLEESGRELPYSPVS
jgi:uncharacterized protein (TIGR03492 family)